MAGSSIAAACILRFPTGAGREARTVNGRGTDGKGRERKRKKCDEGRVGLIVLIPKSEYAKN